MSCNNCRDFQSNSCPDKTNTNCVKWEGDVYSDLDICLDDSLTYVVNIILSKVKDLLKGRGIILTDLDLSDCTYLNDKLGNDEKNLLNVLEIYKQGICELKASELDANSLVNFADVTKYTLGCLLTDPCNNTIVDFKSLIQNIITKLCALNTSYNSIAATLSAAVDQAVGDFLVGGAIQGSGVVVSGSGATAKVTLQALVPPFCPIVYTGSTSYFDAQGKGLPNTLYAGWFLCNGNNGTPNRTTLPQNAGNSLNYIIRLS